MNVPVPRWHEMETVDVAVLEARRRRMRLIAQHLLAVALAVMIAVFGVAMSVRHIRAYAMGRAASVHAGTSVAVQPHR